MKEFPEFYANDIREDLCLELRESVTENGCIQLLPGVHKSDGVFYCAIAEKRSLKMPERRKRMKWQDAQKGEMAGYEK